MRNNLPVVKKVKPPKMKPPMDHGIEIKVGNFTGKTDKVKNLLQWLKTFIKNSPVEIFTIQIIVNKKSGKPPATSRPFPPSYRYGERKR